MKQRLLPVLVVFGVFLGSDVADYVNSVVRGKDG